MLGCWKMVIASMIKTSDSFERLVTNLNFISVSGFSLPISLVKTPPEESLIPSLCVRMIPHLTKAWRKEWIKSPKVLLNNREPCKNQVIDRPTRNIIINYTNNTTAKLPPILEGNSPNYVASAAKSPTKNTPVNPF